MNMKQKLKAILLFVALAIPLQGQASLQSEMNGWFGNSAYSNGTPAGRYQSQMGGYYTGGSISESVPVRQVGGFGSFTPPSFSGGCGGIDINLGGFNLVNKDQIVQELRSIGQNAKGLAFDMAIKAISALLGTTMNELKGMGDLLNGHELSSCQSASALMQTAGDAISNAMGESQNLCVQQIISTQNLAYDAAVDACTSGGQRDSQLASLGNSRLFTQGNLAWWVMMQMPWLQNDTQLATILMNLTGTTLVVPNASLGAQDVPNVQEIKPQTIENCNGANCKTLTMDAFMNAVVFGNDNTPFSGTVNLIQCDPSNAGGDPAACTVLLANGTPQPFDMTGYTSIKAQVKSLVSSIYSKIHQKGATYTPQEKAFIESVAAPIYRYMLVSATAFGFTDSSQDPTLDHYIDLISQDIVATNLSAMLDTMRQQMIANAQNPATDKNKQQYLTNLDSLTAYMNSIRKTTAADENYVLTMRQQGQQYEKVIIGRLSMGTLNSAMFGR